MENQENKEWFESWFDSPYYHILYKERNEKEAQLFLDNIISFLKPSPGARILDVACGKGRHAIYLNKKGFDVTGFDLSHESVQYDLQFQNEKLSFYLHDMREVFRVNYFDYVFNLFSSFGYFEKDRDNANTIFADASALKPGGILVIDYMNSMRVLNAPCPSEEKKIEGIRFAIKKEVLRGKIIKEIFFSDKGKDYHFAEKLSLLTITNFERYFSKSGLELTNTFGNYKLEPFDENKSYRLILVAKKTMQ